MADADPLSAGKAPPNPHLWSRDGFVGANVVALRGDYVPDYISVVGPHAPHRLNLFDIPAEDHNDPEALPTVIMTSREGVELAVTRRRQAMTYTFRNAEADELYFVQSGEVRFRTDFGVLDAGPLDIVHLPRAMSYRVEPLGDDFAALILASPKSLRIDTPAPFGMIYENSYRFAQIGQDPSPAEAPHRLLIRSFDGCTRFEMAHDPLPAIKQLGGRTPVWAVNLRNINPVAYTSGPGGPPAQFLSTSDTDVMCFTLSARPGGRPPVHHNADYDELILFAAGPGAWGSVSDPGTLTWVPKAVTHHGPNENVPEGYQALLMEVRPTMRLTPAALKHAALIETGLYGLHPSVES